MSLLQNEQDLSTRRNAFQFLTQHDQQRAINYLLSQVGSAKCLRGTACA